MGILTSDEMYQDEEEKYLEVLDLIRDGVYNFNRPSNLVIEDIIGVIRVLDKKISDSLDISPT